MHEGQGMQHLLSHEDAAGFGPPKSGVPGEWLPRNPGKMTLTTDPSPLPAASVPQQNSTSKILCTPYIKRLSERNRDLCPYWE